MFEGDDWDYDADYYYRDSDIYAKIVKCLKKYLHHELVPYRKYNPEYNPFEVKEEELPEIRTLHIGVEKEKARDWYRAGGELKELALKVFTFEELC